MTIEDLEELERETDEMFPGYRAARAEADARTAERKAFIDSTGEAVAKTLGDKLNLPDGVVVEYSNDPIYPPPPSNARRVEAVDLVAVTDRPPNTVRPVDPGVTVADTTGPS